ncbi:NnrS family protein [Alloalcanivorax xenomutans]|uniref:NnrS family protein n=1 Tax=Alloalcanivorax xenomutans TaxID=1094342 RepID=UPI0024E2686D|nr:NnrS family protein [Alloalcanivorax xenomutans]WOD27062.1 NnrS family protein [Alloalcanivorax xenomutans]
MDQISRSPRRPWAVLFAFPFRIFFVSTGVAAVLLLPLWLWWLLGGGGPAMSALLWHQHEMTVGLLNAAIAGFLLTAVCNWTGTAPVSGRALLALWGLWLSARLGLLLGDAWQLLAVSLDLAFLPVVAMLVARRVWTARQARQAPLIGVLLALWGLDVAFHWSGDPRFLHGLVLLGALLILMVGGRITPAFTANWLRLHGDDPERVRRWPALDIAGLVCGLAVVVLELTAWRGLAVALAGLLAALIAAVRLAGWAGWRVRREPLLWILHLGHLWVVLGFGLWAAAKAGLPVAPTAWVHALGAGAIGTMILGVITRVAMGHTGRPMRLLPGMRWGFLAILAAGLVRVLAGLGVVPWLPGLWLAAALWLLAWLLFLWLYTPVLAAPRADGRPG